MSIEITIRNIRGISELDETLAPGLHVRALRNGAGKSTLAACISACLGRDEDPMNIGGGYVRLGAMAGAAVAEMIDTSAGWRVAWKPGGARGSQFEVSGPAPLAPEIAASAFRALDAGSAKRRAQRWLDAVGMEPLTRDDLIGALCEELGDDVPAQRTAAHLAEEILSDPEHGWQRAEKIAQQRAKDGRDRWESAVAQADGQSRRWGTAVGAQWRPTGWTDGHEGLPLETIDRRLHDLEEERRARTEFRAELDQAAVAAGEAAERRARLEREAARLEERLAQEVETPDQSSEQLEARIAELDAEIDAAAAVEDPPQTTDVEKLADEAAALRGSLRDARRYVRMAEIDLSVAEKELAEAQREATACPTCGRAYDDTPDSQRQAISARLADVEAAREELAESQAAVPDDAAVQAAAAAHENAASERREALRVHRVLQCRLSALETERKTLIDEATANALRRHEMIRVREQLRGTLSRVRAELSELVVPALPLPSEIEFADQRIDEISSDIRELREWRTRIYAYETARDAHRGVMRWRQIGHLVGPEGIRRVRLLAASEWLRAALQAMSERVSEMSDIGRLTLDEDFELRWDDRPLQILSAGERWLATALIRVAVAAHASLPVVALDDGERVDKERRDVMHRVLDEFGRRSALAILVMDVA